MFSKIRGDIRKSRCTTCNNVTVNYTGGKFCHPYNWCVDTCRNFATGGNDTGGNFALGVNDDGGK